MQKILFISTLSSSHLIDEIYKSSRKNLGFAVQKFNRLIVEGFQANGVNVSTISFAPLPRSFKNKWFYKLASENVEGIYYNYTPYCRLSFLKRLLAFFSVFFTVLFWGLGNKKKKTIVCDVLNISICLAALLASKIVRLKSIGIMTEMHVSTRIVDKILEDEATDSSGRDYLQNTILNVMETDNNFIGHGLFSSWHYIGTYPHTLFLDVFFLSDML